jgi:hypothetical protein
MTSLILNKYFKNLFKNKNKIKNKTKKKIGYLTIKKKKKVFIYFIKNFINYDILLDKILFINIKKEKNNVFLNYLNFDGNLISKYSSGIYSKRCLRKTFYAINLIFQKSNLNLQYKNKKKIFFLNIKGDFNKNGFKKNIKTFLKFNNLGKFKKLISLNFKAHNGIRRKKAKRK